MSFRSILILACMGACAGQSSYVDSGEPDAGLPVEVLFRDNFLTEVQQQGSDVFVYAARHAPERFRLEFTVGSWSPSKGFSTVLVAGETSTKFGGDFQPAGNGVLVVGLDPERVRRIRVLTPSGLVKWGDRDWALVCNEPSSVQQAQVLDDGAANVVLTNGGACVESGCSDFMLVSTDFDGGFLCPLKPVCGEVCGGSGPVVVLHPKKRIAGLVTDFSRPSFAFFEWDSDGQIVRTARLQQSSRAFLRWFWPSAERRPTRLQYEVDGGAPIELRDGRPNPDVQMSFLVWDADGGLVREEVPFGQVLKLVDSFAELPTGVVVSGRRSAPRGALYQESNGSYLVDPAGTRILGRFEDYRGLPIPPNVFVEGQYFHVRSFLAQGDDENPRNYSGVRVLPVRFIPAD